LNFKVFIAEKAYQQIQTEVKRHPGKETGGIMVGFRTPMALIVSSVSGPGPSAIHLPFSIQFDEAYCNRRVKQLQRQGKVFKYIGDWHSHPFSKLKPSKVDKYSFKVKSLTHYGTTNPLMIIAGPDPLIPLQAFLLQKGITPITPELIDSETMQQLKKQAIPF